MPALYIFKQTIRMRLYNSEVKNTFILIFLSLTSYLNAQVFTSLEQIIGEPAGVHTFNFGDGEFEAYCDGNGWVLWLQYHRSAGVSRNRRGINLGENLPMYDSNPLGTGTQNDNTKWGHATQAFAASIPDDNLWLRWEGETTNHSRKIHFESPIIGTFQSPSDEIFYPKIKYIHILLPDHTANLPVAATNTWNSVANTDLTLTTGPFFSDDYAWNIAGAGRFQVDNTKENDGTWISTQYATKHRVWVKHKLLNETEYISSFTNLINHINGTAPLTAAEIDAEHLKIRLGIRHINATENIIAAARSLIETHEAYFTPILMSNLSRQNNRLSQPSKELEYAILTVQQAVFENIFTPEVYAQFPNVLDGFLFGSSERFPGSVAPPSDSTVTFKRKIRANYADNWGMNANIAGEGEAIRPTGLYLAPGSIGKVRVPSSLVNKGYHIRVGAHTHNHSNKSSMKRLDIISKKIPITQEEVPIYNPLGGAVLIQVPFEANDGIVEIEFENVVQAPFFSAKDFDQTSLDQWYNTEINHPAPWAVFESDKVMFHIPSSHLKPSDNPVEIMEIWDKAMDGIQYMTGRPINLDVHSMYMGMDISLKGPTYGIGYPLGNQAVGNLDPPASGTNPFLNNIEFSTSSVVNFHEYGHSNQISMFVGEPEAIVHLLHMFGFGYGHNVDIDDAFRNSWGYGDKFFTIDLAATNRFVTRTFLTGAPRDISNTQMDEVRYQHMGHVHYADIVKLFGWCALRNFFYQENLDFEGGITRPRQQQNDDRILRMSIAAGVDLRPLLHAYGIHPNDPSALATSINNEGLLPSISIYNRLVEMLSLIPVDNQAFVDYALAVTPNMYSLGPTANPNFGQGYNYQKSLTYDAIEGQQRIQVLQDIIDLYFPSGAPADTENSVDCTNLPLVAVGNLVFIDEDEDGLYTESVDTPVEGVEVTLVNADTDTRVNSQKYTDENGNYYFDELLPGNYYLKIDSNQFVDGALLDGYSISETYLDDDVSDNNNNGQNINGIVQTGVISLQPNQEIMGEDQTFYLGALADENVNATIDFAFVIENNSQCIDVQLYAFLEGSYDTLSGKMNTYLNRDPGGNLMHRGLLPGQTPTGTWGVPSPAGQPFSGTPWNYQGTQVENAFAGPYAPDVVDWVLISIRAETNPTSTIKKVAALLKDNGRIEFLEPCSLSLTDIPPTGVYIGIEHRNHIAVGTPQKVVPINGTLLFDFRMQQSYVEAGGFGQKEVVPGVYAMFAGDGEQEFDFPSYQIGGTDKIFWSNHNGLSNIYLRADYNLDGSVDGEDKSYLSINNGVSSRWPR